LALAGLDVPALIAAALRFAVLAFATAALPVLPAPALRLFDFAVLFMCMIPGAP
jgi:hypothetical protein